MVLVECTKGVDSRAGQGVATAFSPSVKTTNAGHQVVGERVAMEDDRWWRQGLAMEVEDALFNDGNHVVSGLYEVGRFDAGSATANSASQ